MKKVFTLLLLGFVGVWLVDVAINFVFRNSPQGIYKKIYQILVDTSYYDVWIIGSSRAETAYETNILSKELNYKFFNAGIEGANFQQVYYFLKRILHQHSIPKYIIYDIDAYNIADTVTKVNLPMLAPFLYIEQIRRDFSKIDDKILYAYYFPMYELPQYGLKGVSKFIRTITNMPSKYDTAFQNTGCFHLHFYQKNIYCYIDTMLPKQINDVKIHPLNKMYIDSIVNICRKKGIGLVFSISPIYQPEMYIKKAVEKVKEYTEMNNIVFLDFSYLPLISSDKENFSDKYHLHFKGSVQFTDTFRHSIQSVIQH